MFGKGVSTRVATDGVEDVNDVEEENSHGRGHVCVLWCCDVVTNENLCRVANGVESARNADAELALGEEVCGEFTDQMCEVNCANNPPNCGSDPEGAWFVFVRLIFVKGEEILGAKGGFDVLGEALVVDED